MKNPALAILLLAPTTVFAATTKPNPADYPVRVHVVGSQGSGLGTYQHVEAIIDGKQVELQAATRGLLVLGDYQAQPKPGVHPPKDSNGHDIYQAYELLFSDGTTRYYEVVGLGTPEPTCVTAPSTNP
jgi:hypothetical protein